MLNITRVFFLLLKNFLKHICKFTFALFHHPYIKEKEGNMPTAFWLCNNPEIVYLIFIMEIEHVLHEMFLPPSILIYMLKVTFYILPHKNKTLSHLGIEVFYLYLNTFNNIDLKLDIMALFSSLQVQSSSTYIISLKNS